MQLEETTASDEVIDQDAQQTAQEIEQAEENAAFAASLNNEVRAEEAPAAEDNEAQAEVTDADNATQVDEASDEPAIEAQVGVTPEQLTAMLAKMPKIEEVEQMTAAEIRKVHGKIGELNRALLELQKNGQGQQQAKVNFSGASFKRMQEEFPEIAEILAEDFNNFSADAGGNQSNETIENRVAQVREELSKDMQKSLLLIQHKDAPKLLVSDDYKVWKQTLPEDERAELDNSWDAMYIGEKLTDYKNWFAAKNSGAQERKERLQRAITPKSTQAALKPQAMTELDGFNSAFKR